MTSAPDFTSLLLEDEEPYDEYTDSTEEEDTEIYDEPESSGTSTEEELEERESESKRYRRRYVSASDRRGPIPNLAEEKAEQEIAGDFDRLIQGIRMRDATNEAGMLSKDWDINIEEQEAEFRDDLRAASGIGKRRRKRARNAGPVLSQQVKSLIGDGNQAYVDNDFREAIRIMQEVIRIEPRAVAAWTVLAQCYEDMGEPERALQLRIMAAHLRHDADDWERLARESRDRGFVRQSLYCYQKLTSLDPTNVDAYWERASLAKENRDFKTARNAYLAILRRFPHDLPVLNELHMILIELGELTLCAELFQQALEHYQEAYPTRPPQPQNPAESVPGPSSTPMKSDNSASFGAMELFILADLYNTLGQHEKAIRVIRSGTRWIQGRGAQKYWDLCPDDREYDEGDVGRFVAANSTSVTGGDAAEQGATSSTAVPGTLSLPAEEQGLIEPGMFELDINARHRLAVARIKMGDFEEGKIHADIILSQDVFDYSPLYAEIADAYFEKEMYAEAKPIYELLGSDSVTSSMYVLLQTAACLRMLDELKEAAEVYEAIKQVDPSNMEVKTKLAEVYELLNEPRRALDLIYEVIDARRRRRDGGPLLHSADESVSADGSPIAAASSLFPETRVGVAPGGPGAIKATAGVNGAAPAPVGPRLTQAQLRELEKKKEGEVVRGYKRLLVLWPRMFDWELIENVGIGRGYDDSSASGSDDEREGENKERIESKARLGSTRKNTLTEDEKLQDKLRRSRDAEREWMIEAEKLVETFRETRKLFLTGRQVGFKGMFPRRRRRRAANIEGKGRKEQEEIDAEAEENRMAARLVLDMEYEKKPVKADAAESVDVFRGVSFDDWLRVIIQYAFILTQRGQHDIADEVLRHILLSNAYQTRERQDTIRIALITCAIHAKNPASIVEHSRKLINAHQFNNEPLRIMLASLSSGLGPTDAFITSTLQKHLFREMRMADAAVVNPSSLRWNKSTKRWAPASSGVASMVAGTKKGKRKERASSKGKRRATGEGEIDEDDEDEDNEDAMDVDSDAAAYHGAGGASAGSTATNVVGKPTNLPRQHNPVILAIYGQVCIAARSYQSAIFYLLQAYDYCANDPMICLCLAIASIGRAMQRQADNRHHLVAQGMAFLTKYRSHRGSDENVIQEVEYNFGRAFHQLGLYSYAVKHYERVLNIAEKRAKMGQTTPAPNPPLSGSSSRSYLLPTIYPQKKNDTAEAPGSLQGRCVKEAAYNLAFIYVTTGATPLADEIYKKWLSI